MYSNKISNEISNVYVIIIYINANIYIYIYIYIYILANLLFYYRF